MKGNSAFSFVLSSSVRVDIVGILATEPMTTDELLDRLDASQSAVYTAVSDLEQLQVLFEGEAGWELTGRGRLILDIVEQWESVESFVDADAGTARTQGAGVADGSHQVVLHHSVRRGRHRGDERPLPPGESGPPRLRPRTSRTSVVSRPSIPVFNR
ncbi:winged helix-turn-helix domain-containing protein [Halomicroarcula sp. F28]|uniref:winged helix-turn-helix domain-containing protein n=1 Tax=Haloarcula salinisoli TaxID=2487746 RepID=UPI001C73D5EA|nr:winged helix-turn-helix domain-containing protein [Halomicroarcula salinisoli]MBX0288272.1 winged helix-turn-helix domain-containing protein [Halomicroarcula salinisoli]